MLKVLYIVGDGSTHENIELRWSLRSLEKFATCDVEPVIVGEVPGWFKGTYVNRVDRFNRKEKNIMDKILFAIEQGVVDDFFQISADDHFWLKPIDLDTLPVYYRQPSLQDELLPNENNYAKALVGTRKMLEENGFPFINTTVHCNQWVNARTALQVKQMIEDAETIQSFDLSREYGLVSWAVWPNVAIGNCMRKPIAYKRDIKIRTESYLQFKAMINDQDICSVNDNAFENPDIVSYFRNLYNGKCRWEK